MELLALPPEVFERIMAFYVRKHGIVKAWKIRSTCKTFLLSVNHEIFARQPISAFLRAKRHNGRAILRNNLGTYLSHRVIKLFDAHTFLPNFLNGMVDQLIMSMEKDNSSTTASVRTEYMGILCNQLAEECKAAWSLVTTKSSTQTLARVLPMFQNNIEMDKVAAAAAVGNLRLLRELLQSEPKLLWERSYAFGHPLAAAAVGNHFNIVKAIVKHFENTYRQHPIFHYEAAFTHAFEVSLTQQNFAMAKLLLQVYRQYFPVIRQWQYEKWLSKAISDSNEDIILELSTLRTEHGVSSFVTAFELVCKANRIDKIKFFFETGLLGLNQCYYQHHSCPIASAVTANKHGPVVELLSLGADPDGVCLGNPYYYPLWIAIANNNIEILQELLTYGANPYSVIDIWRTAQLGFRKSRAGIGAVLEQALSSPSENYRVNKPSSIPCIDACEDAEDLL